MPDAPITVAYYYKVRWGFHDEWLDLFERNHWPLLRQGMRDGRMLDVKLYKPRFHGDGRADWDVMVTITYRDWAAIEDHTDARACWTDSSPIVPATRSSSSAASSCSRRTGTWCWRRPTSPLDLRG